MLVSVLEYRIRDIFRISRWKFPKVIEKLSPGTQERVCGPGCALVSMCNITHKHTISS